MPKLLSIAAAANLSRSVRHPSPAGLRPTQARFLDVDEDIRVRRTIVHAADPQAGRSSSTAFPKRFTPGGVWTELADEYEVHAFDWPGFGLILAAGANEVRLRARGLCRVSRNYIEKAGIDRSRLIIYATDIGALPAPARCPRRTRHCAHHHRWRFRAVRSAAIYAGALAGSEIASDGRTGSRPVQCGTGMRSMPNAMRRGLGPEEQFEILAAFKEDMTKGWVHGDITSADAFYHYYSPVHA